MIAGWSGTQSALLQTEDCRGDFELSGFLDETAALVAILNLNWLRAACFLFV